MSRVSCYEGKCGSRIGTKDEKKEERWRRLEEEGKENLLELLQKKQDEAAGVDELTGCLKIQYEEENREEKDGNKEKD